MAGKGRRGLVLVLALALVIRAALLLGNISEHPWFFFQDLEKVATGIESTETPYMNSFGWEASNIAHAWVCGGQGYASPFGSSTGPTAWIAPGVVSLYALSFALWGCFTFESILFVFLIALVISLLTTVVVFRIGTRIGGDPDAGFLAALFFACLPFEAWIFSIAGHLDFNLQVLWFAVLLLAVLRAVDASRPAPGLEFGVVSSVAALFNPGLLLCAAAGFFFVIRARPRSEIGRSTLFMVVAHFLILGPAVVTQSLRLGGFVPVKSNAIFEMYLGNTADVRGMLQDVTFETSHPSQNAAEFAAYTEAGEIGYLREVRRRFCDEFRFGEFLENSLRRGYFFFVGYQVKSWDTSPLLSSIKRALWAVPILSFLGLVLVRRGRLRAGEGLLFLFPLAYALPYLLTGVMERYRIPMVSAVAVALALVALALVRRDSRP